MRAYSLTHVGDQALLRDLAALVEKDRVTTAAMLAHIAEVDARRLYAPAGYSSMFAYCVQELRLSEDAAYKRIQAARTARCFPALFLAVAEGALHLGAVCLLAPHLTRDNAGELIAGAALKTKSEIEQLLAQRFPRPDMPQKLTPLRARELPQLAPGQVVENAAATSGTSPQAQLSPGTAGAPRTTLKPLSPERFALQVTLEKGTHDKLQYARELLSHQMPSGDLAQVLDRAIDSLITQLEKRRFAATDRPRKAGQRGSANARTIPAHVKREVWKRDRGQCTFVAANGRRCVTRKFLEFDHVDPVARGGTATVSGMRLRCRTHNQHEAEQVFGAGFMHRKRQAAMARAAERSDHDVLACLETLGYRAAEARRAAAFSATKRDAPLEERVRLALSWFLPKALSRTQVARAAHT